MRVIVIGGGVVGATTALALVERGLEVTLIERRERLADDTSHANGGGITPLHSEPWNGPDLARNLVRYLGRGDAPWQLPARVLPSLGGWGLRFLLNTRRARFSANARANMRLGLYSLEQLQAWREKYAFDYAQTTAGSMQIYRSSDALDAATAQRRALLEGLGEVERLDSDATVAREPALAPVAGDLAGALYYPAHESGDAARFAEQAAERAVLQGARLRLGEAVQRLVCRNEQLEAVETDRETIEVDACVIATGPETPGLLNPVGLRPPIRPVRGYSATYELAGSASLPNLPLLDAARRFVTLRLGETGLRIAGLADFAGHRRAIPPARLDVLLDGARALLPELADELTPAAGRLWSGLRPMTPDGKPLLGETRVKGVYLNTGHGPMGWTFASGCARAIADRLVGRTPAIDLAAYAAER